MTDRKSPYRVLIPYREPTYEMRRPEGVRPQPFTSEFEVSAACDEDAVDEAVRRFKARELQSSVAWVREIDHPGIRVQRMDSQSGSTA